MGPTVAELLERNEQYVPKHQPMPLIKEIVAAGGGPPSTAIITCVDPRVVLETMLSLNVGDVFIFRTVAGHPQTALSDLATLDMNSEHGIAEIMIMYHTDCGTLQFDLDKIRSEWAERDPSSKDTINEQLFGSMKKEEIEGHLHADVEWLKDQPLLKSKQKSIAVHGYMYDIKTGKIDLMV